MASSRAGITTATGLSACRNGEARSARARSFRAPQRDTPTRECDGAGCGAASTLLLSRYHSMWRQNYTPVADSLALSALVAMLPVFTLLFLLGVKRKPAWISALSGLAATVALALFAYRMPPVQTLAAATYGAAFGLFPIGWIVFWAIVLYRITLETGRFELIKNSVASLTSTAACRPS